MQPAWTPNPSQSHSQSVQPEQTGWGGASGASPWWPRTWSPERHKAQCGEAGRGPHTTPLPCVLTTRTPPSPQVQLYRPQESRPPASQWGRRD